MGNIHSLVALQKAIYFNSGAHLNHTLFWESLCAPADSHMPEIGPLHGCIVDTWGSMDEFISMFNENTALLQGSGWGWLVYNTRLHALSYRAT